MQLHLKGKQIAFSGMMVAMAVILIILSGVIESSTFFLLCAASFLMGLVIRQSGNRMGVAAIAASVVLGCLLAPQKLYCATFLVLALYIFWVEQIYGQRRNGRSVSRKREWLLKALGFHVLFFLAVVAAIGILGIAEMANETLFRRMAHSGWLQWGIFIVAVEVCWIVFDQVYRFFQIQYGHYFLQDTGKRQ